MRIDPFRVSIAVRMHNEQLLQSHLFYLRAIYYITFITYHFSVNVTTASSKMYDILFIFSSSEIYLKKAIWQKSRAGNKKKKQNKMKIVTKTVRETRVHAHIIKYVSPIAKWVNLNFFVFRKIGYLFL